MMFNRACTRAGRHTDQDQTYPEIDRPDDQGSDQGVRNDRQVNPRRDRQKRSANQHRDQTSRHKARPLGYRLGFCFQ